MDLFSLIPDFPCREVWTLPHVHVGRQVLVFPTLDSTNTQALRLGNQVEFDGLVLLTDEQQAGRGQQGRHWIAPARSGVLLSILLFPPEPLTRPVILTALAAVAVCRLVAQRTAIHPTIKWPNDVLVHGRKICGILIEQARHNQLIAVVIGVGLNVTPSEGDLFSAGLANATSLAACNDPNPERDAVAREFLHFFDQEYATLLDDGPTALEERWASFLDLVHRKVMVQTKEESYQGCVCRIRFSGLTIEQPNGQPLILQPETVRHIRPD